MSYNDEVRSHVGGTSDKVLVGREQVPDVPALHHQQDEPVDARHRGIERERRGHVLVLTPYCAAEVVALVLAVFGAVEVVE